MSSTYQIHRKIRDAVILNLRRIFTGHSKYPYIELVSGEYDFDNTKIVISDAIPQDHTFFPALIVDSLSGTEQRYLGPDDIGEIKDTNFEVTADPIFSSLQMTLTINLYSYDTIARDEIIDLIYDHLKLITDDLADNGIEVKKVALPNSGRQYLNDRWLMTSSITLDVYSEWVDTLPIGDLVAKIPIDIVLEP